MTHREARRKLGSRSRRRANTNGKIIKGKGGGGSKRSPCYRNPRPVKRVCVQVAKLVASAALLLLCIGCAEESARLTSCVPAGEFVGYEQNYRSTISGIVKTTKGEIQVTSWERLQGMYGEPVQSCRDSLTGPFITIGGRRY